MTRAILLLCASLCAIGCTAGGVPNGGMTPAGGGTVGESDVQAAFDELVFAVCDGVRGVTRDDAHAPVGPIATTTTHPDAPGGGSLTTSGNAAPNASNDESFSITLALDHYHQANQPVVSSLGPNPGIITVELSAIPDAPSDPQGQLGGSFRGNFHDETGRLGDLELAVTLDGAVAARADGTHDLAHCGGMGGLSSTAYPMGYHGSSHPF